MSNERCVRSRWQRMDKCNSSIEAFPVSHRVPGVRNALEFYKTSDIKGVQRGHQSVPINLRVPMGVKLGVDVWGWSVPRPRMAEPFVARIVKSPGEGA